MSWKATYIAEQDLIECIFSGHVAPDGIIAAQIKVNRLSNENNCRRILVDDTKWKTTVSELDIYSWPKLYEDLDVNRNNRIAVISPPTPAEQKSLQFYETVCRNRGWQISLFSTRQQALDWLLNEPAATTASDSCV